MTNKDPLKLCNPKQFMTCPQETINYIGLGLCTCSLCSVSPKLLQCQCYCQAYCQAKITDPGEGLLPGTCYTPTVTPLNGRINIYYYMGKHVQRSTSYMYYGPGPGLRCLATHLLQLYCSVSSCFRCQKHPEMSSLYEAVFGCVDTQERHKVHKLVRNPL